MARHFRQNCSIQFLIWFPILKLVIVFSSVFILICHAVFILIFHVVFISVFHAVSHAVFSGLKCVTNKVRYA